MLMRQGKKTNVVLCSFVVGSLGWKWLYKVLLQGTFIYGWEKKGRWEYTCKPISSKTRDTIILVWTGSIPVIFGIRVLRERLGAGTQVCQQLSQAVPMLTWYQMIPVFPFFLDVSSVLLSCFVQMQEVAATIKLLSGIMGQVSPLRWFITFLPLGHTILWRPLVQVAH